MERQGRRLFDGPGSSVLFYLKLVDTVEDVYRYTEELDVKYMER
jgi:hypothetical protein